MITILFCSRVKDNPASALPAFLDSLVRTTSPAERASLEVLIKHDDDDDAWPGDGLFRRYPLAVRTYCWSRGEGRHGLHHAQEYLFAQRDRRSRFCLLTADDFVFTRPGWVSDVLAVEDELAILAYTRPDIERLSRDYERPERVREWVTAFGEWSPVVGTRLIEVCQNLGWQANVDSWLMGLSLALYDLYRVVLWKPLPPFYERTGGYGLGDTPTYNNMELTLQKGPLNPYWFELVRRQARNVYLNREYGTDLRRRRFLFGARRLWGKLRAEPLHRLPSRLWRRLCRDARRLFGLTPPLQHEGSR